MAKGQPMSVGEVKIRFVFGGRDTVIHPTDDGGYRVTLPPGESLNNTPSEIPSPTLYLGPGELI